LVGIWFQPFYRFDLGPVEEGSEGPSMWRIPMSISSFDLPDWYAELDPNATGGIIELPLEQQQDLLCAYQSFHQQKVYRGSSGKGGCQWATEPAIPPAFRRAGGGVTANRMRWIARSDPNSDPVDGVAQNLTSNANTADLSDFMNEDLIKLMDHPYDYRWLIVHERGYYLVPPDKSEVDGGKDIVSHTQEGWIRYDSAVRKLQERLAIEGEQHIEIESHEWPGMRRNHPICEQVEGEVIVPAWIPWASQEVPLGACQMPESYRMHVFDLAAWRDQLGPDSPDGRIAEEEGSGEPAQEP
jgi:hypothetical protein